MRLIDADKLYKDVQWRKSHNPHDKPEFRRAHEYEHDGFLNLVNNQEPIDAVPVVRCRECKWADWYDAANGNQYCHCLETEAWGRTETDYCSYGKREDGDKDE